MTASSADERAAAALAEAAAGAPHAHAQAQAKTTPAPQRYGGFRLGGMDLALPMTSLREVVPYSPLTRLPCPAACVIGGINLRGVMVPVVDLRIVLGLPTAEATHSTGAPDTAHRTATAQTPWRSVIIMVHGGHILGLLVDGVSGVFSSAGIGPRATHTDDPVAALFSAAVPADDSGTLVSVLSPDAINCLPQVPRVPDPEPARQQVDRLPTLTDVADTAVPMVLMRCGHTALAIDAQAVHATLLAPHVARSVLSQGSCRGCIDYAGEQVAAIDLMAWCGLGSLDSEAATQQAFVVQLAHGRVAFLIDAVIDVVRTQPQDVITLPAFALPRAALFAGTLPLSALSIDAASQASHFGGQPPAHYLLLDSQQLRLDPEVSAMAETNTPSAPTGPGSAAALTADARAFTAGVAAGAGRRSLVTFTLEREAATPLSELTEILPYPHDMARIGDPGPLLGIMVNRGRSIAVMCLSQMVLGQPAALSAATSVLVVASAGELLGFSVPSLRTIESTDWEPELPAHAAAGANGLAITASAPARQLALVGSGATERMLPVLDLQALARGLQARAAA